MPEDVVRTPSWGDKTWVHPGSPNAALHIVPTWPHHIFFFSFDPDMTVRHTVWGMLIGGYFTWVSIYGINQTQVQRYLSVPEKKKAVT